MEETEKYTKDFEIFNPMTNVIIITSCIVVILNLLRAILFNYDFYDILIPLNVTMFLQLYILFPAWIAYGRDCKYKEFILFSCIFFIVPIAYVWASIGEKNEYDYPV